MRPLDSPSEGTNAHSHERRRSIRVDALGQVEARSVWRIQPLSLLDLSLTGMSLEATSPFESGTVSKFRLSLDTERRSIIVQARVRHCSLVPDSPGGLTIYRIGFEFVAPSDATLSELVAMIEAAEALWRAE